MANNQDMRSVQARPSDIISNLPDNIIESILMCLPTRDAVRTSILSKMWRYRWAKLPKLILDEMFWDKSTEKHSAMNTVKLALYQIVLRHEGPIKKFTLSFPGLEGSPEIDNVIFFLSLNGIEDLKLNMQAGQGYMLPLSFFTCLRLRRLSLQSCLLDTPPAFKGFSRLVALKLHSVGIRPEQLESLISICPLLERLGLRYTPISDDRPIEVDAPNMKIFRSRNSATMFIFKNVPRLSVVTYLPFEYSFFSVERATYKLAKFFNDLPAIKKLNLNDAAIESLVAGGIPSRLLTTLVYLQDLKLFDIALDEYNELSFVLCLLRSSPNLNFIKIKFSIGDDFDSNDCLELLLKEQGYSNVMLNQLKEVKMFVTGSMTEVEFIKFLLAKSPNLKQLQIQLQQQEEDNVCKILKELANFPRASTEAEVIFIEWQEIEV